MEWHFLRVVDERTNVINSYRTRCKTCPFISNMVKISGPNRSAKISDHFTCISANVIYCITCTLCKKIYIGETGRRLADRFREHLRDVEKNDTDASKPVARHFNLPNHSHHNMTICGLSLHHGNTESRKNLEQKFIFQLGTLYHRCCSHCTFSYLCYITNHLMTGLSGNSSFCFPRLRLRGTLKFLGKQNELFPSGPVIKCLLLG